MNRFNIFYNIHKALRAMLYETALLIQQTDFSQPEESTAAITAIDQLLRVFDKHAETEDHFILKATSRFDPQVTQSFTADHVKDFSLSTRMRGLFTAYAHTVSSEDQCAVGQCINQAFVEFMIFNLQHMGKEEQLLNPVLWKHYSDDQLRTILFQLQSDVPEEILNLVAKWLLQGLSNTEIIAWLKQVENQAAEKAFWNLLTLVETVLPAHRRERILESMTEGALLA